MRARKISFGFLVICSLTGCSSLLYYHDPKTGLYEERGSYLLYMFTTSVDEAIQRELRGEHVSGGWHQYWIWRCEIVYHDEGGEQLVQYIVRKRREAGLPNIPEIDERKFN
jgi:hypothetical protein